MAVRGLLLQVLHEFGQSLLDVGAVGTCWGAIQEKKQAGYGEGGACRGDRALPGRAELPLIVERACYLSNGAGEPQDVSG